MPATWLKPKLVCEIKFLEWTGEKILRIPIFLGLREDKEAKNEKEEKIISAPAKKEKLNQSKKMPWPKQKK